SRAVHALVDRHEILRTSFRQDAEGNVRQYIAAPGQSNFEVVRVDLQTQEDPQKALAQWIAKDSIAPFDFANGPLLRVQIYQLAPKHLVFYYNMHHIISDAWSKNILYREVLAFYQAFVQGSPPSLPALRIQYKDFVHWQEEQMQSPIYEDHRRYWLEKLSGDIPRIDLPLVQNRPPYKTHRGGMLSVYVPKSNSLQLKEICTANNGSLFMGLLTVLNVLLYKYTGLLDISLGTPMSGREHFDLENQIGLYVNTLVLRNQLAPSEDFVYQLTSTIASTLEAYRHQMYPFDKIVEDLDYQGAMNRNPIFDVMLVWQQEVGETAADLLGAKRYEQLFDHGATTTKFDLLINVQDGSYGLQLTAEYNSSTYSQSTIANFLQHFRQLCCLLCEQVDLPIEQLSLASREDVEQIQKEFNLPLPSTAVPSFLDSFVSQVIQQPDAIALKGNRLVISYRQLEEGANRLANFLTQQTALLPQARVGVCLEATEDFIVTVLAILKCGAVFVPIDPSATASDSSALLQESEASAWITNSKLWDGRKEVITSLSNCTVVLLQDVELMDDCLEGQLQIFGQSDELPLSSLEKSFETKPLPGDGLLGLFYDHSNGTPVLRLALEGQQLARALEAWRTVLEVPEKPNCGAFHSISQPSAAPLYFLSLSQGWTVCLSEVKTIDEQLEKTSDLQLLRLSTEEVRHWLAADAKDSLENLKTLLLDGGTLDDSLFEQLIQLEGPKIYFLYGKAETLWWNTVLPVGERMDCSIGRPLANGKLVLLDSQGQIVPVGVAGELYIGQSLPMAKDVADSMRMPSGWEFHPQFGEYLFATTDKACWLPSGELLLLPQENSPEIQPSTSEPERTFWTAHLDGDLPLLDLPSYAHRPLVATTEARSLQTCLSKEVSKELQRFSQDRGVDLTAVLLSIFYALAYRYTGQQDILLGSTLQDQAVGDASFWPLRIQLGGAESGGDLLSNIKQQLDRCKKHTAWTYDRIVKELGQSGSSSRQPLFDVVLTVAKGLSSSLDPDAVGEQASRIDDLGPAESPFDLRLDVEKTGGYLLIRLTYKTAMYQQPEMKRFLRHFQSLARLLVQQPTVAIDRLPYLEEEEQAQLLQVGRGPDLGPPIQDTFKGLIEAQVERTPDAAAIHFHDKWYSYREMNEHTNQLAHFLHQQTNIKADDLIGLRLKQKDWMVLSVLAIVKAGAAYVPIDADYPPERQRYMEQDSNCRLIIDEELYQQFLDKQAQLPTHNLQVDLSPHHLIFLIYTSGSTGQPKGIMMEQAAMINLLNFQLETFRTQNITQFSSISFDMSFQEIFSAMIQGACLHLIEETDKKNPSGLLDCILTNQVDTVFLPTAYFRLLMEDDNFMQKIVGTVRQMVVAGEQLVLSDAFLSHMQQQDFRLYNFYGPAETHVVTFNPLHGQRFVSEGNIPSIGFPIRNTSIYLLDAHRQLVPKGVVGELYIGGWNVARGYINKADLTAERFLSDPHRPGERLYKTGDLARWMEDGSIGFIGRRDHQVKIRGYRIEMGELESILLSHEKVAEAVVIAVGERIEEKELRAYYVASSPLAESELLQFLREQLPEFMIPAYLLCLPALPLTTNGKVKRSALPDPTAKQDQQLPKATASISPMERKIMDIWQQILKKSDIGPEDDFFRMGGHSLRAVRLLNHYYKAFGVRLQLKDLFVYTQLRSQADLIERQSRTTYAEIPRLAKADGYPLSDAQRRLWILSQLEESSVAYNMPGYLELMGSFEWKWLDKAIRHLIRRHEILRTVFRQGPEGEPFQWIQENIPDNFVVGYTDLSNSPRAEAQMQAAIQQDIQTPFDLAEGPLLRVHFYRLAKERLVFFYNMHHIVGDGWSLEVLTREFQTLYQAYQKGEEADLPPLRIQYKDYAAWQLASLEEEASAKYRSFWMEQFSGELPILHLPSRKLRPAVKTYHGHCLGMYLPFELSQQIRLYCQEKGASLFMGLLALWKVLLFRYTSQEDIIIGTPVAGRGHTDLEDQIGYYINLLPLRNQLDPKQFFDQFFDQIRQSTLAAFDHQLYPFDRLVEDLRPKRDLSRHPLFDIMLTLQNTGDDKLADPSIAKPSMDILDQGHRAAKLDLDVVCNEWGGQLYLEVTYNSDIYEKMVIQKMMQHFRQLSEQLMKQPRQKIGKLVYLSEREQHDLLERFQGRSVTYDKGQTLVEWIDQQARQRPEKSAIVFGQDSISYDQLSQQSHRLAKTLVSRGLTDGQLVGICMDRSIEMVIAMLAVWKAGGAYLPIDPAYPRKRIQFMLDDTATDWMLSDRQNATLFEGYSGLQLTLVEEALSAQESSSVHLPSLGGQLDALQYVIYTSGSTGRPKGVMISQKNVNAFVQWCLEEFADDSFEVVYAVTSICFDLSIFELFYTLAAGKTLRLLESSLEMVDHLSTDENILLNAVPSVVAELLDGEVDLSRVCNVNMAGEPIPAHVMDRLDWRRILVRNLYGPSEDTTYSSCHRFVDSPEVLIGRPIANTKAYLLDERQQLLPKGWPGELYLGGDGLALGYWNRPQLTEERFISNPFSDDPTARLYRTGDLARWNEEGQLEFIGRKDRQIKLRGYRMELGEIETVLERLEAVRQSVVMPCKTPSGEEVLTAYVQLTEPCEMEDLRQQMAQFLPAYMVPSIWMELEEFPLTPNGKIDKKALPPVGRPPANPDPIVPASERELAIAAIWQDLLQASNPAVTDDFFQLGGHSLQLIRLANRYHKQFQRKIPIKELFLHTTIAAHAQLLAQQSQQNFASIPKASPSDSYPLSDAQRRLWVLEQVETGTAAYHLPGQLEWQGDCDPAVLQQAIRSLASRHEILRTVFRKDTHGNVRQWILPVGHFDFSPTLHDLQGHTQPQAEMETYMAEDIRRPFDLENGPLLRSQLFILENGRTVFYYNMHHIISDAWSKDILYRELMAFYQQEATGRSVDLPGLAIQYKDYAVWQLALLEDSVMATHRRYWTSLLSGELPTLDLPSALRRPQVKTAKGHLLRMRWPDSIAQTLQSYSRQEGGSLFTALMSCLKILCFRYTGQKDLIIGTPVAGREHPDLEHQIGFYVNTLVCRTQLQQEDSFATVFGQVTGQLMQSYAHQQYPFDRLVEDVSVRRTTSRHAIFDLMLSLQRDVPMPAAEPEMEIVDQGLASGKFDLEFGFEEGDGQLSLSLIFHPEVYDLQSVRQMMRHFVAIAEQAILHPSSPIGKLDYLGKTEREKLLAAARPQVGLEEHASLRTMFEELCQQHPHATLLGTEHRQYSYLEVDRLSNQLANYLLEAYAIREEKFIPLLLPMGEWPVIAILAVLKLGKAFVPLDLGYPQERIEYILKDCGAALCIDGTLIESFQKVQANQSDSLPTTVSSPADLAYVIYTSGSTGRPKGVLISAQSLISKMAEEREALQLGQAAINTCLMTNLTFDVSMLEIFLPILGGGSIAIPSSPVLEQRAAHFIAFLTRQNVQILQATPSWMEAFFLQSTPDDWQGLSDQLHHLCIGGDSMSKELFDKIRQRLPGLYLHNHYGPTECTIDAITNNFLQSFDANVIGRPMARTGVLLLDEAGELVPKGVKGEICIVGPSLAEGYLNLEEQTARQFVDASDKGLGRMYRTGDIGRWLPGGEIEFIGRKDNQLKIRGHRVELGEIEQVLRQHPDIRQAEVLATPNERGEKELRAYFTADQSVSLRDLYQFAKDRLPPYMLPAYFVQLDVFPLLVSGKVDRTALRQQAVNRQMRALVDFVAARTVKEQQMAEIWADVLGLEQLGIDDDFFELGGNSLSGLRVLFAWEKLHSDLPFRLGQLFAHTSIRSLMDHLQAASHRIANRNGWIHFEDGQYKDQALLLLPGSDGVLETYHSLLEQLLPAQDVSGIDFTQLLEQHPKMDSIEDLADELDRLLAQSDWLQKYESIAIVGHSFGGIVGFELLKRLEQRGITHAKLSILDMTPFFRLEEEAVQWEHQLPTMDTPEAEALLKRHQQFATVVPSWMRSYRISGRVLSPLQIIQATDSFLPCEDFARWKEYGLDVEFEEVAGNHFTLFQGDNSRQLLDQLQEIKL
ncbi:MAG: amino acid adenylation domain-containing protein, partial [Bacteroidota bacterium]